MGRGWTLFLLGWALIFGGGFLADRIQDGRWHPDRRCPLHRHKRHADERASLSAAQRHAKTSRAGRAGRARLHQFARNPGRISPSRLPARAMSCWRSTRPAMAIAAATCGQRLRRAGRLALSARPRIVDPDNIGLEGHSMGGWAVLAAAAAQPDGYKAMVLEGRPPGRRRSAAQSARSDPEFPEKSRPCVYSRYDEFAPLMWGVPHAKDVGSSAKLMALFGTRGPRACPASFMARSKQAMRAYSIRPPTTHPGDHISPEAIGDAVDWFGKTLKGGSQPPMTQSGSGRRSARLIAFGRIRLADARRLRSLSRSACFSGLTQAPEPACAAARRPMVGPLGLHRFDPGRDLLSLPARRRMGAAVVADFSAIDHQSADGLGASEWRDHADRRSVVAGVKASFQSALARRGRHRGSDGRDRLSGAARLDFLFKTDFRFWVVALKLLESAPVRLVPGLSCSVHALFRRGAARAAANLAVKGDSPARQYATALGALAGGFLLFLIAEYAPLFAYDELLVPSEALNAIISIQFLPLTVIVAVIAVFTWRRTNSYLPGAFICGLFVTWYIVAGTAVQFAG